MPRGSKPGERRGGRSRGTPNKTTREMKEWALEFFESPEWRRSAKSRILEGKAPHLETHVLAVLMPKPKDGSVSVSHEDGEIVFRWATE